MTFARAVAGLMLPAACTTATARDGLDFDRTFDVAGEPAQAWYAATYVMAGREHSLEVWRDREARIKRVTDGVVETHVVMTDDPEWTMTVLDRTRRIRTDIGRTNLHRIGHVVDWFELAHSLTRPKGPYALTTLDAAPRVDTVAPCRWYRLDEGARTTKICWSSDEHIALAITDADDRVQWRVTRVSDERLAADVFSIDDRGYVRNDADREIEAD